jgi:hypothetical protein
MFQRGKGMLYGLTSVVASADVVNFDTFIYS